MNRHILSLFSLIVLAGLLWYGWTVREHVQVLQDSITLHQETNLNLQTLQNLKSHTDNYPPIWPLSEIKHIVGKTDSLLAQAQSLSFTDLIGSEETGISAISAAQLDQIFVMTDDGLEICRDLQRLIKWAPEILFSPQQQDQLNELKTKIETAEEVLQTIRNFQITLDHFYRTNARVVILLQNQNEPRSTGGFIGSMLVADFSSAEENAESPSSPPLKKGEKISINFIDIYELDRQIPAEAQIPAPEWFHGLSSTISLRDANLWPDFPTTAATIREFFTLAGERPPEVVLAVNLNIAEELIRLTGPVELEQWGLTLDEYNFDTVLQFLVEGKIMGRFNVKEPVNLVIERLISAQNLKKISREEILNFDWATFFAQKNLLAYSENENLQQYFDQWQISGRLQQQPEANNFLHFDFVSIGANKSEKFLWTKLNHDSEILRDGKVINTLKITRNHALRPNEISELLGDDQLSDNIRDLLSPELKWKLGAGENRTMLRVWIPKNALLFGADNPAGEVTLNKQDPNFDILEVPLNVLPGERLVSTIKYGTQIERGSHNWRPYHLQLVGTSGRSQTKLLTSISTEQGGRFKAETFNIGRPTDLIDQDFRAVVQFE